MDQKLVMTTRYSDYISDFRAPSKIDVARIMKTITEEKRLQTDKGAKPEVQTAKPEVQTTKPEVQTAKPEVGQTAAQTQRQ